MWLRLLLVTSLKVLSLNMGPVLRWKIERKLFSLGSLPLTSFAPSSLGKIMQSKQANSPPTEGPSFPSDHLIHFIQFSQPRSALLPSRRSPRFFVSEKNPVILHFHEQLPPKEFANFSLVHFIYVSVQTLQSSYDTELLIAAKLHTKTSNPFKICPLPKEATSVLRTQFRWNSLLL